MIRKGEPWGEPVHPSGDEPVAASDRELAALVHAAHTAGEPPPLIVLTGGDLRTALGGSPPAEPHALPIDLLEVVVDGRTHHAVAHVVVRNRWWQGRFHVAMNGSHLGSWNLGPKAHPNDGIVDVTTGALGWRERAQARRRALSGSHVPHPSLSTSRVRSVEWTLDRPTPVWIDGERVGSGRVISITVLVDAANVIVG